MDWYKLGLIEDVASDCDFPQITLWNNTAAHDSI